MTASRRQFIATSSLAAVSLGNPVMAMAALAPEARDAATAFLAAHQGRFDPSTRLEFLLPDGLAIVHDVPFPLDRMAYADHLAFHGENWESHEWIANGVQSTMVGETRAVVSCYYMERGKPRDAGFRLRPGFATATCVRHQGEWKALGVHFSALRSQILDASPS